MHLVLAELPPNGCHQPPSPQKASTPKDCQDISRLPCTVIEYDIWGHAAPMRQVIQGIRGTIFIKEDSQTRFVLAHRHEYLNHSVTALMMAGDWREQYLAALKARDTVEKANVDLYNYCARLADQKAELQNKVIKTESSESENKTPAVQPPPSLVSFRRVSSPPPQVDTASVVQMRQDLSKAQQQRVELQTRLDQASRDYDQLKTKARQDSKRLAQATTSVSQLTLKLRDREEELKGKAKLVENVQDENVTLNLQLNIAEEQQEKLKKENKELVDRWMARMGKEADRMNEESKFD